MNFGIAVGAELLLSPQFKVGEMLNTIQRERCTLLFGVPTIYSALTAHREFQRHKLSSLRICVSGGAPLAAEVKSNFETLAGCDIVNGYGLTEASPVCTLVPPHSRHKPGSAGLPLPGTVIEIASLTHPNRILSRGESGEICIRGPQVMAGYWKQPKETAAVLKGGLLRTGDFGYVDEDGYLFIVDRIKDMIISGGFNIYPRCVEEAIGQHHAVAESRVWGVADHHRGERVKAYVKLREGAELTAAELRAFLKDKLAPFELPSEIDFLAEFPPELRQKLPRRKLLVRQFSKKRAAIFANAVRGLRRLFRGWQFASRPLQGNSPKTTLPGNP